MIARLATATTVAVVLLGGVGAALLTSGGDDRRPRPSRTGADTTTGGEKRERPQSARALVRAAVIQYVATIASGGGAAACLLFPDDFQRPDGSADAPSRALHPHPAPADGCQPRRLAGFTNFPAPAWRASRLERLGRVRFAHGLARAGMRVRSSYVGAPDLVEHDLVWLRRRAGEWQVARPSLIVYRVFDTAYEPADVADPPTRREGLDREVRAGTPAAPCQGRVLGVADRVGLADGREERAPSLDTDLERIEVSRPGRGLCLRVHTRATIRSPSYLTFWFEQPGGGTETLTMRVDARGRTHVITEGDVPVRGAKVGASRRTLTVHVPVARAVGLGPGRFAFAVHTGHENSSGTIDGSDMAPNTRTRLFFVYPSGRLTDNIAYDPRFN